jgi:peptide/nickel transport system substrate-binding protein
MQRAAPFLLAAILVLLVVDLLHRDAPHAAAKQKLESLDGQLGEIARKQDALRADLERLDGRIAQGVTVAGGGEGVAVTLDPARDGETKEGVNFLLPYDRSHFRPEKVGGTLRFFDQTISKLNDVLESQAMTRQAFLMVNDSLVDGTPEQPELASESLATSCIIDNEYRRYTFTIRKGVKWHVPPIAQQTGYEWLRQPVELTAHDFLFWLEMVRHPDTECHSLKVYYENLESAEALDDYTLRLTWKTTEYTNVSFSLGLAPFPRHVYTRYQDGSPIPAERVALVFNDHWFDKALQLIGVGRWMLVDFDQTKGYRFRRNPDYWGAPEHFDELFWDVSTQDPDPQLTAFKNGQVHWLERIIANQYKADIIDGGEPRFARLDPNNPKAGREGVFGWERIKQADYGCTIWNMRKPQLRERAVRQALAHCYPRQRILEQVLFGLGEDLTACVHPDNKHYNKALVQYAYDIEQARRLLDSAGWRDSDGDGWRDKEVDGQRTALRLDLIYYVKSVTMAKVYAIYKEEAAKAGIELRLVPVEDKEWDVRKDNRDFDGFSLRWSLGLDVDFKQLWHSSGASEPKSSNMASFADPEADQIIDDLRKTFVVEERDRLAKRFQEIIHREQPYLFMNAVIGIGVWQNRRIDGKDRRELLDDVVPGFDDYHPLMLVSYRVNYRKRWTIGKN